MRSMATCCGCVSRTATSRSQGAVDLPPALTSCRDGLTRAARAERIDDADSGYCRDGGTDSDAARAAAERGAERGEVERIAGHARPQPWSRLVGAQQGHARSELAHAEAAQQLVVLADAEGACQLPRRDQLCNAEGHAEQAEPA